MLYGLIPPCCSIIVNTSIPSKPRRCARFGWNMMKYAFYATTYQSGGEGQGDTHLDELLITRVQSMSWTPVSDVACIVVNFVLWDNVPGKISRRSKTFPPGGHFPGQSPGTIRPPGQHLDNYQDTICPGRCPGIGWFFCTYDDTDLSSSYAKASVCIRLQYVPRDCPGGHWFSRSTHSFWRAQTWFAKK